jgi:hypothetical protein
MVHLLAYVPERRGEVAEMIEEPIEVSHVEVALRVDGRRPTRVYQAPSEHELPFTVTGEYIRTTIPTFQGCAMVVFDDGWRSF